MLTGNSKYDKLLPKHQKKIVLCLAKNEPMTMSQTNRKLRGENTSTTRAFHALEAKGMIKETGKTEYRGRTFSKYWLTERGAAFALLNGANPEIIRTVSLALGRDRIYFDIRDISPRIANVLDVTLLFDGVLKPEELIKRIVIEVATLNENERLQFLNVIRDSGKFEDAIKNTMDKMKKFMDELKKTKE